MSAEHRNLVDTLAMCLAREAGTEVLGDALEDHGMFSEDGPMDAEGFLDMHRRDVRIILSELRAMGKLK